MSFENMSIGDFSSVLASRASVPGGGGASALCAALANALGCMVGELTVGKDRYKEHEPTLLRLMGEAEKLRKDALTLIDADAKAFSPLAEVYSLPKSAPGREERLEKCLVDAADTPLRILKLGCRSIELLELFAKYGSRIAVSDAGTGAAIARAAIQGAAMNVYANTRLMKNRSKAELLNIEVDELLTEYLRRADSVCEDVKKLLTSGE